VLHSISWHDNTAANKFNPDPDAQVSWGERTIDEMGASWISYYYMSEEDFKKESAERQAKQPTRTAAR
jgi:C1A family cysteine protease